jgi:3-methyl-2-oxobutanoate hydroxymethyltransferase
MTAIKNILDFKRLKSEARKFSVITCYDYTSAIITANSNIDVILVGDSVAMTMHGEKSTVFADTSTLALHTKWVLRGLDKAQNHPFLITDMPFLSTRSDLATNINAVHEIMRAGADAIKIEGADGNLELIAHLTQSGIPVCGHLGLTPQSVNTLGGYKVQGKTEAAYQKIINDAKALEEAGCFAIVLECVPTPLAQAVTKALAIPTIGIGAGNVTDAQVLVWQDLLGLNNDFKPKFVRRFADGAKIFTDALNEYHQGVLDTSFPSESESFK